MTKDETLIASVSGLIVLFILGYIARSAPFFERALYEAVGFASGFMLGRFLATGGRN